MIRILVLAVIIIINYVLQTTLFPVFAIFGVVPDTALVLIVSYAILRGDIEGALFGFFAGLVHDIMGGLFLGLFALLGFVTGYYCGRPFKDFFKDNYFLPFFVVVGVSFVYQLAVYAGSVMIFGQLDFWFYLRAIILPKTIYTASMSVPIYALLHFINARLERLEQPINEI
jgi:rod shape-determining protein MreD